MAKRILKAVPEAMEDLVGVFYPCMRSQVAPPPFRPVAQRPPLIRCDGGKEPCLFATSLAPLAALRAWMLLIGMCTESGMLQI